MASHGVARPATAISRTEQEKLREQIEITEYRDLEHLIRAKITDKGYTREAFDLTSKLLKKNPEYYTFWNIRRRILIYNLFTTPSSSSLSTHQKDDQSTQNSVSQTSSSKTTPGLVVDEDEIHREHVLELIESDLRFLFPIMLKFPKCYWLWNYRLWLLQQANERLDLKISRDLWSRELSLVGKMLNKDSRNFHGWGYRRMVVTQLESTQLHGKSMVETEFEYTTKMIHAPNGLSNFSAWHRRSKLIPCLLDERSSSPSARRQFLDDEFNLIISAMYTDSYPYQQSAWFYYQFLMTTLVEPDICHIVLDFTLKERCRYVYGQLDALKEMLDGAEDCKWIYNALIDYTFAICKLEAREINSKEIFDCKLWLLELKKLDSFRRGRWIDLENCLTLHT